MIVVVLLVLVTLVYAAMREVLARVDEQRTSIAAVATLLVLGVLPERIGRAFDNVSVGVVVTAALCAPLAVLYVRRRVLGPVLVPRGTIGFPWVRATQIVVVILGAWCAWTTYFWDEDSAHFGVSSSIARGVLPPVHPLFPSETFRYHFAYDVLVSIVRSFTGATPDVCCDVVTTVCLMVLVAVAADAGRLIGGARASTAAALSVLLVPFGYGPAAICLAGGWSVPVACSKWFPAQWVDARTMPPTVISNFFQHPQGLGMCAALAILLVGLTSPRIGRVIVASVSLALSSQAQAVYFALTAGALIVGVVVAHVRSPRTLAISIGVVIVGSIAGLLLGGVFSDGAVDAIHFGVGYFSKDSFAMGLAHNLVLFGLPLVAIPFALVRLRDDVVDPNTTSAALRTALVAAAIAGFVVGNVATYERSWDIVKFFAAGAFFGNVVAADVLTAFLARRTSMRTAIVAVVLVASTSSATFWVVRHGILNGVIAPRYTELPPDPVGAALDDVAGKTIGARAHVLTTHDEIAQWGFLVVGHDWRKAERGLLLDRTRVDHERDVAHRALTTLDRKSLDELHVDYILLAERERAILQPRARFILDDADKNATLSHGRILKPLSKFEVGTDTWHLYGVIRDAEPE